MPQGFLQHQEVLPDELLNCLEDIAELQAAVLEMRKSTIDRIALSNMQASIESRLAFEDSACKKMGVVAECCRVAALITCFLSFTDTWANALIPCRLSDILQTRLRTSIASPIWAGRRNLQIWIVLVGSYATVLNNGFVDDLHRKWTELSALFHAPSSGHPPEGFNAVCIESATQDFMYCSHLLERRLSVPAWAALELSCYAQNPVRVRA
jgi:hypothetical protein